MTTARLGSVLLSEREAAARASSAHDARAARGGAGPEALTPGRIVVVSSRGRARAALRRGPSALGRTPPHDRARGAGHGHALALGTAPCARPGHDLCAWTGRSPAAHERPPSGAGEVLRELRRRGRGRAARAVWARARHRRAHLGAAGRPRSLRGAPPGDPARHRARRQDRGVDPGAARAPHRRDVGRTRRRPGRGLRNLPALSPAHHGAVGGDLHARTARPRVPRRSRLRLPPVPSLRSADSLPVPDAAEDGARRRPSHGAGGERAAGGGGARVRRPVPLLPGVPPGDGGAAGPLRPPAPPRRGHQGASARGPPPPGERPPLSRRRPCRTAAAGGAGRSRAASRSRDGTPR